MAKRLITSIKDTMGEWEFYDNLDFLDTELKKTRIKEAFCEILNGGWRGLHGISPNFELTAENLFNMCALDYDYTLEFYKNGHKIEIIRYSHDEPTGATILLHPISKRKSVEEEIFD